MKFLLFTSLLVLLFSCRKDHTFNLGGTYSCTVNYSFWSLNNDIIYDTYAEDVEVIQDGNTLTVLGRSMEADLMSKEHVYYYGQGPSTFELQFRNDSIFAYITYGGLGSHTTKRYKGAKIQ